MPSDPNPHNRRPDMSVCRTCAHFREKHGESKRWTNPGRPPSDWRKECVWFHSEDGRRASSSDRLGVMLAGANGGRGCTRVRET